MLDAYPVALATRTYTIGATRGIVTSQYGLQLMPHWNISRIPSVDRLLVPGSTSMTHTDASLVAVAGRLTAAIVRLHDNAQPRFAFEAPLEDLAREENVLMRPSPNKRLEYRAAARQLIGTGWPVLLLLQPLLIGGLGVVLALWLTRRYDRQRYRRSIQQAADPARLPRS